MDLDSIPKDMTVGDLLKRLTVWQWMWVLGVVVVLVSILDCSGSGGSSSSNWDRNIEVMTIGQEAIRQQLRFPSTASFSEHNYGQLNNNEYFYTALVRAENSFGNKVPSYWHVVLAFEPGTAKVSQVISVTQTQ